MASSHIPDTETESTPSAGQLNPNAPLLSVLRHDNSTSAPALHFESAAGLLDELEDSDEDAPRSGEKRSGRRKIKIEYIDDKSRRHITFSKRKAGIMKKAYELSTLTGTQVLLLVASETGHVYTFATPKLQPLITKQEGKNLIQACLNSPDHGTGLPDYLPSVQSTASSSHYENELGEDDLATRSGSSVTGSSASAAQLHGYLPTGTTPTPPAGASAASVAAAAAQVFMGSGGHASQYVGYSQQAASAPYWNGGNAPSSGSGMYAPIPAKGQSASSQQLQQSQQQQQQQQQMYHALLHQQQLFQQYQQQQQQQHHKNHDNNDA